MSAGHSVRRFFLVFLVFFLSAIANEKLSALQATYTHTLGRAKLWCLKILGKHFVVYQEKEVKMVYCSATVIAVCV